MPLEVHLTVHLFIIIITSAYSLEQFLLLYHVQEFCKTMYHFHSLTSKVFQHIFEGLQRM